MWIYIYIYRAPASWVSLFAVTLTTHCDDTFRTAHTCLDDTLRRPISWPHITPWRRIPPWRHIMTTHSLTTHYPLTTHSHLTTHCDDTFPEDTLPPDDALPCDDALWPRICLRTHYPLTTHYPVTTHCDHALPDDALPPDVAVPCSDGTFPDDHYSLTTLGNDAFPFMLHDPPDRQDPDASSKMVANMWQRIARTKRFLDCYFCFASYIGHALVAGFLITLDFCSTMFLQGGSGITP